MTQQALLLKEIDGLPPKYLGEVIDFAGYLRQKAARETNERAVPKDKGAPRNADEGASPHPNSDALFALLAPIRGTVDVDEIRTERIMAKHFKHLK